MSTKQGTKYRRESIDHGHRRDVVSRVRFLYLALMIVGVLVTLRLVWVQMVSPSVKHNAEILEDGVFRIKDVAAHRGSILTNSGEPLAISSIRYNAEIDFASEGIRKASDEIYAKNVDSLARLLAQHFSPEDALEHNYKHITASGYRNIFHEQRAKGRNRSYKLFPRLVTIDEWNILHNYPILNGNLGYVYYTRAEDTRLYPLGDVARQVIGRHTPLTDKDNKEIKGTGIEYFYDEALKGHDGKIKEQWIAHGFWARVEDSDNRLPENGCNIITTIDAGLQRVADDELRKALQHHNASFGVAIVMEVETGNILSMVNLGSGRERGNEYTERVENHALRSRMMPGSTMKLATSMALLEIGGYTLDTKVNTEHSNSKRGVKVGNAMVYDTHDAGEGTDGNITLVDAFAHSSNVYFAKAVYERFKDNPAEYTNYLAKLRFNDYVGMQEFGEMRSKIPMAGTPEWNINGSTSTRLPRLAYGYEMETPPIHMITFFNGVANEGRMVAPRIVDRIECEGEVIMRMPTQVLIPEMCSKRTLKLLDSCLVAASGRTSGQFNSFPTTFGCKTGTAQMWSNFVSRGEQDYKQMLNGINKDDNYYYGSIVCVMPADKPKYTILVGVCKQVMYGGDPYYGILLAGPVANDIMTYIYANDPSLHAKVETPTVPYCPTKIKAGNSSGVAEVSRKLSAGHTNNAKGSEWSRANIDAEGKSSLTSINIDTGKVPDVRGMGLSDALYLLESMGMTVTHSGHGAVRTQSIEAGAPLKSNNLKIHLTLR